MYSVLFLATMSFFCCYALTPLVRGSSRRLGLVDRPGARRKHVAPTPRTGGIAIVISYLVPVGILLVSPLNAADSVNLPFVVSLLPAAFVVFATGLLDDLVGLKPWEKIVGQVFAACMAYAAGVHVSGAAGYAVPGLWSLPITVLWLVACANAFNLIDGVDGLASGVGLFAAFTTLAAALLQNNAALALATAPLVGALLAFLRYNFNPASIFLGDSGSLTIGFVLGCFGAIWSQKSATLLGMTAPLMALSIPLLDAGLSIVRRFLRHQPIFKADRNHIHHRLLDSGFSPRQVALVLYAVCGLAAAFSLIQTVPGNKFHGLLLVVFCVAVSIGVKLVGYVEFDTARQLVLSGTFRHILNAKLYVDTIRPRIAAAVHPEDYWGVVRDVGREFACTHVRMSLAGSIFEERQEGVVADRCCDVRIPFRNGAYVNFRYPVEFSVSHALALSLVAEIFQESMAQWNPQGVLLQAFEVSDYAARTGSVTQSTEAGMAR
jgi:UDP-GlcNAc:undecaprenyl-phosphate GlcNAc-1-phosphate transferase